MSAQQEDEGGGLLRRPTTFAVPPVSTILAADSFEQRSNSYRARCVLVSLTLFSSLRVVCLMCCHVIFSLRVANRWVLLVN